MKLQPIVGLQEDIIQCHQNRIALEAANLSIALISLPVAFSGFSSIFPAVIGINHSGRNLVSFLLLCISPEAWACASTRFEQEASSALTNF